MFDDLPDVQYGDGAQVTSTVADENDDDEQLAQTPKDVIALLGFDPLEEDDG